MQILQDLFYEEDPVGKQRLSYGRTLLGLSFLMSSGKYWILGNDAPATLVTAIGIFAGYVFAGKAKDTVVQYLTTKNGNGNGGFK